MLTILLCAALAVGVMAFDPPIPDEVAFIYQETASAMLGAGIISADNAEAYKALVAEQGQKIQAAMARNSTFWPKWEGVRMVETEMELRRLIKWAAEVGEKVRVAGAQHSAPQVVFGDEGERVQKIKLSGDFRKIKVMNHTNDELVIRAGAGANLGHDPMDPESTNETSVIQVANSLGFAFPMLGGVSFQTVGGFLMTSTTGNTVHYTAAETIQSLRWIDGRGRRRYARWGTHLFNAVGVSMGLYGVLTEVTFRLTRKAFLVGGQQDTVEFAVSKVNTSTSLVANIRNNEYFRAFWWPQEGLNRVVQTHGNRVPDTTPIEDLKDDFDRYFSLTAAAILWYVSNTFATPEDASLLAAQMRFASTYLIGEAVPLGEMSFVDKWWVAIPLDDPKDPHKLSAHPEHHLLDMEFSEMWVDLELADAFYNKVNTVVQGFNFTERGNFFLEWYSAKASPFWMSPSHERDVLRLDLFFWHHNSHETVRDYFGRFWKELADFPTLRFHWGKWQPQPGEKLGEVTYGPTFISERYPKFAGWKEIRRLMDPDDVFVTSYWKGLLGL